MLRVNVLDAERDLALRPRRRIRGAWRPINAATTSQAALAVAVVQLRHSFRNGLGDRAVGYAPPIDPNGCACGPLPARVAGRWLLLDLP